jgi:hypothetical protein
MARWAFAIAALALIVVGCGGSGTVPPTDTTADTSDPEDAADVQADLTADEPTPDAVAADESPETPPVELPGEVVADKDPPQVLSSIPADEASDVEIPFTVQVTFNEPIRYKETVDSSTFRLIDMYEHDVEGTLSYDEATNTVTFTPAPTAIMYRASPYRITLSNIIQDKAGNRMVPVTLTFSTFLAPNLAALEALAIKYSPLLYQSVSKTIPQFDYPTSYDFDGDWLAANNDKNIMKATSIPAWVYYDSVETKSHYFIRYAYFYPRHTEVDASFGNDVAGAIVVVAKRPTPTPIAVETYFGSASKEDLRSFVTAESGIVTDNAAGDGANGNLNDKDRKYFGVNWVFPQATLFPSGHYQAYLTTGAHESCAWAQTTKETTTDFRCVLSEGSKKTLSIVRYAYVDGVATELNRDSGDFPIATAEGEDIGYGLRSILRDWWVRRDRLADMFSSEFTYAPPTDRPGANLVAPTTFVNTTSEADPGGRPPWAWSWKPTVLDFDFYFREFNQGTIFLDPAYYFAARHRIVSTTSKDGFSSTYCFNPYLLIDQRGKDPDCSN